jgi:hypothetical protein
LVRLFIDAIFNYKTLFTTIITDKFGFLFISIFLLNLLHIFDASFSLALWVITHFLLHYYSDLEKRKESGNKWEEQLKLYNNLEKNLKSKKKEDWLEVAERRIKKSEKEEQEDEQEMEHIVTNNVELAPLELREMYHQERRKKMGLEKSHSQAAKERLSKLFKFMPGPYSFKP